jgi:hypothetical protein
VFVFDPDRGAQGHAVLWGGSVGPPDMGDLRRFDIAERKWLAVVDTPQRGDVPYARQWAYGATHRNASGGDLELLMFFGVEWDPTPPYVAAFTDAHALRLSNDTWRQLSSLRSSDVKLVPQTLVSQSTLPSEH